MKAKLSIMLAGAALLGACADGGRVAGPAAGSDPLVERLVSMGARREQIVDRGDHFVVEGDIRILKKDVVPLYPADGRAHPGGPQYQRYHSAVGTGRRVVRVNLSAVDAENAQWASATRSAMAHWSAVPNADVVFVEGSPADITVSFVNDLGDCTTAMGAWPASGAPGATVSISRRYAGSYNASQQVWVMAHELGHNVGLAHTDQPFYNKVAGTPDSDGGSVMNSGNTYGGCPPQAPNWAGFSYYDQVALRSLYPLSAPPGMTGSYPNGTVVVSWGSVAAAAYYEFRRREFSHYSWGGTGEMVTPWSPVYGTSIDTESPYTGWSECVYNEDGRTNSDHFFWEVRTVSAYTGKRSTISDMGSADAAC